MESGWPQLPTVPSNPRQYPGTPATQRHLALAHKALSYKAHLLHFPVLVPARGSTGQKTHPSRAVNCLSKGSGAVFAASCPTCDRSMHLRPILQLNGHSLMAQLH